MKKPAPIINNDIEPMKKIAEKINKHIIDIAAMTSFIAIAVMLLLWGRLFTMPGDEMGYVFICYFCLIPIIAFGISIFLGVNKSIMRWPAAFIFGAINNIFH